MKKMNRTLLRLFLRLFDVILEQIEAFRYEDATNKDFWIGIKKQIQATKNEVTDKFDM